MFDMFSAIDRNGYEGVIMYLTIGRASDGRRRIYAKQFISDPKFLADVYFVDLCNLLQHWFDPDEYANRSWTCEPHYWHPAGEWVPLKERRTGAML